MAGCTLTGALSVACFIPGAVAVVHAPEGCVHQTFSMLHAMMNDCDVSQIPEIIVSGIGDREVIFGGEDCLTAALDRAAALNPDLIFVVTSCVPETIGDDCGAVCSRHPSADKIIYVPTSGFLGGSAKDGENAVLTALASCVPLSQAVPGTVALIGEKNLESEADQNYAEVERLLARLGLRVTVRFCRGCDAATLMHLGTAECFILRDDRCRPAAEAIGERFKRPVIPEFPGGLSGCIDFLKNVGHACSIPEEKIASAVQDELLYQDQMLKKFSGLTKKTICLGAEPFAGTSAVAREAMERLSMQESESGFPVKLPFYLPVGAAGVEKMLYLWRRAVNNG
ncbi:Light-independent protochlorophyllide reductase subunit B [Methanocorpusculaceae archaeon Cs1]|uniref:Light-independent protochlorophyllide reductase subunit B n=2 Tax=Methanorbis rubei TaxID=3028300 RepID=A0AAE4MG47_9EURY|nr:Light-independent protochlorophyllide reductase subunit B [Methanocorpusculaceae archaeon Cs1]